MPSRTVTFSNGAQLKFTYKIKTYDDHKTFAITSGRFLQRDGTGGGKTAGVVFKIPVFSGDPNRKFKAADPAKKVRLAPIRYRRNKKPSFTLYLVRNGTWGIKGGSAPLGLAASGAELGAVPEEVELSELGPGGVEIWEDLVTFVLDDDDAVSAEGEADEPDETGAEPAEGGEVVTAEA